MSVSQDLELRTQGMGLVVTSGDQPHNATRTQNVLLRFASLVLSAHKLALALSAWLHVAQPPAVIGGVRHVSLQSCQGTAHGSMQVTSASSVA